MKSLNTYLVKGIACLAVIFSLFLFFNTSGSQTSYRVEPYIELINLVLISTILVLGFLLLMKMGGVLRTVVISLNFVLVFKYYQCLV